MFGFSALPMLGLLPLVLGGLWYAYKKMGQAQRVVVGTSFYLRKLSGIASHRRRFVPPLRFVIELLALLLLVFAAAGVVFKQETRTVLVILDDSRSMGAIQDGATLLERAVEGIEQEISAADSRTAFSLITTSLPQALVSAKDIDSRLRQVRPLDVEDKLEVLIPGLVAGYDEVSVYSDRKLTGTPSSVRLAQLSAPNVPNVGIIALSQIDNACRLTINRSGPLGTSSIKVAMRRLKNGKWDDGVVQSVKVVDTTEVVFSDIGSDPLEFAIRVPPVEDSINADNKAWLVPSDLKLFRLHGDISKEEFQVEGYKFVPASSSASGVSNDIFYKVDGESAGNALYILPPSLVASNAAVKREAMSRWQSESPLLKYLFSADIAELPYLPLTVSSSFEVVAAGAGGGVLAVSDSDRRTVVSGLDLLPFDSKNVARSIITLNILEWLSSKGVAKVNGAVFQSAQKFLSLAGESQDYPINSGLYRVEESGKEVLRAVNLYSAVESRVGVEAEITKSSISSASSEIGGMELWRYLVYLVLALALGDLLYGLVRRRRA